MKACTDGTVASYLGHSCRQDKAVFYWSSYQCTSTPSSLCDALGPNGSNVNMRMDPNGPHTILVGGTDRWNVSAGQNVHVLINGTVYGASTNINWPHFNDGMRGQTGDGTENNITAVDCASTANCLKLDGVSEIPCNSDSPQAYCTHQAKIAPYQVATAKFNPATADRPYPMTIEVKLNGGTRGSATLRSIGMHVTE